MNIVMKQPIDKHHAKICDLNYGTIVTGVPNNPESVYLKMKKCRSADATINWTQGHCVLLNLKTGTIRAIPATSVVTVLDGHLNVWLGAAEEFLK